ncbi:MAG: dihydroorotate dehydrogenase electron transfer subunit [Gammaproteobacteria bacterium]|jgi:dihydroorotate dehydrogenase electron transfer subunit
MQHPQSRNTINVEDAKILSHQAYPGEQYILRLFSPNTAADAKPGSFIHIQCDPSIPMRRPMSIMRTDANNGWIEILYKVHGNGTKFLSTKKVGDTLSLLGPIGVPFKLESYSKRPLLIGGGVGIPPMICLAEHIKQQNKLCKPFLIAGSEIPFPFNQIPSQIMVPGIPEGIIATMPLMEDWGIACRLTSLQGYPGCYEGYVTDLARIWLDAMENDVLKDVEIFTCGPTVMLDAVARLSYEYNIPCQVSLEEYMACAVGGCAGCVVEVLTEEGISMKRVCVDGPVFEASTVFPPIM